MSEAGNQWNAQARSAVRRQRQADGRRTRGPTRRCAPPAIEVTVVEILGVHLERLDRYRVDSNWLNMVSLSTRLNTLSESATPILVMP